MKKLVFYTNILLIVVLFFGPPISSVSANSPSSEMIIKKVYILAFDPLLSNDQKLSSFMGWNSYTDLSNQFINFFDNISGNRLKYSVAYITELNDIWPEKIDGFSYDEQSYLDVVKNGTPHHEPDTVKYSPFINELSYDVCGKLNRGEIDELWVFGGPWFGFYESRLTGPNGFWYNSPPLSGTTCNKLLPIMGFNYERGLSEMMESYGHRSEATMTMLYGGWQQNQTTHNWEKFGLVKHQSPSYTYSGCGSIHYPPNGTTDYEYDNSSTVYSNCNDFENYPDLGDPTIVKEPVSCDSWGCNNLGFFSYWYGHIPAFSGVAPDGFSNDWWQYIGDPNLVQYPFFSMTGKLSIGSSAIFSFDYSGSTSGFYVNMSTYPDMSEDVYLHFAEGLNSPLIEADPTKWDKFSCGQTLYWRVISNSGIQSTIQSTDVICASSNNIFLPLITNKESQFTKTANGIESDGEVGLFSCNEWDSCRNANYGSVVWDYLQEGTVEVQQNSSGYDIKRIFLFLDTSSIPPNAIITNATLNVYATTYQQGSTTVHIVRSTANIPLSSNDFGNIQFVSGGEATPYPNSWMTLDLDSSARDWVVKGGVTKLALVHELDLTNTAPDTNNHITVALTEYTQYRPYLDVTYNLP
ncbi:DNRLRE domain-containing protein [Chloroflexota bacterium]